MSEKANRFPLAVCVLVAAVMAGCGTPSTTSVTSSTLHTVSPTISATATAAATSLHTASPTLAATAAPTATPPAASAGKVTDASFTGCPATAPGQHAMATVTGPTAAGATADAHQEWYGCGSVLMPADYPVFTGNNWELAFSFSCPESDGPAMADGMTIESWVYEGGGTPIHNAANDQTASLPWSDNTHSSVPQAGNYRLKTVLKNGAAGDNRCRWHIRAYATPAM